MKSAVRRLRVLMESSAGTRCVAWVELEPASPNLASFGEFLAAEIARKGRHRYSSSIACLHVVDLERVIVAERVSAFSRLAAVS